MASKKKTVRRRRTGTRGRGRRPSTTGRPPPVLKLSKKARDEVARLLRASRAGTQTRVALQTGLTEVKAQLGVVEDFIFDFRNW
jgi:hypothetical protein